MGGEGPYLCFFRQNFLLPLAFFFPWPTRLHQKRLPFREPKRSMFKTIDTTLASFDSYEVFIIGYSFKGREKSCSSIVKTQPRYMCLLNQVFELFGWPQYWHIKEPQSFLQSMWHSRASLFYSSAFSYTSSTW
jgi:hypothetical protein